MKQYTINVMVIEDGYPEIHTKDLSEIDADELVDKLRELFPQYYYYKDFVEDVERNEFGDEFVAGCGNCGEDATILNENGFCKKCRNYNENAVDGWEDIYPDRDY